MRSGQHSSARALLSVALCTVLLLQGLVPAGYMPAAVQDGGWVAQLCPEGLPRSFLTDANRPGLAGHLHHRGHEGHDQGGASRDYCPVGSAFDTTALDELAAVTQSATTLSGAVLLSYLSPTLAARLVSSQPRAPPIS